MNVILCRRDQLTLIVILSLFFVTILYSSAFETNFSPKQQRDFRFQVDINSASIEELQTLPGIGEKLAEAIVLKREERRSFHVLEEIMDVRGIGAKKFEAIKPHLLEIQDEMR